MVSQRASTRQLPLSAIWVCAALLGGAPVAGQVSESGLAARDSAALLLDARARVRATEYEAAFELVEEALRQSRAAGDPRQEAEARLAMAFALVDAGAWRRSISWIEDTLPLIEELGRSRAAADDVSDLNAAEARMRCQLARAYNVLGNRPRARRELGLAAAVFRRLDDRLGLATVEAHFSLIEVHDGRYAAAIQAGNRSLELLPDRDHDPDETVLALQALSAIAYGQHQRQRFAEALIAYERILELGWKINDQRQMNFAYCNRAEVRWQLGDKRPVEDDLRRAIEGWEKARDRIPGTADQRAAFLAVQEAAYDRLIRFLAETSRGPEAFEVAEAFHARSFMEMLDQPSLAALGSRLPEQWKRRQELVEALGRVRLRLEAGEARQSADHRRLARLEGELQAVKARLIWHRRDLTEPPSAPNLKAIQAGLEPGEVMIAYWLTEERVLVWVVSESDIRFVQIPVPRRQIENLVEAYLEPLRAPRRAEDIALQGREEEHLASGRQLYQWLVGALPREVFSARRWIIVPDGVLHTLPFGSLVIDCADVAESETVHAAYGACRYLGLEKPLFYSSSAGALLRLRHRRQQRPVVDVRQPTLLALAPRFGSGADLDLAAGELRGLLHGRAPLAYTVDEVRRIADHFTGASIKLDDQATERHLKREASRYQLLHLATHGLVSDDHPMSSGVLLVADAGEDGLLQAHEVMGLELAADVVTLSACRTGRGQLRRGSGVVGLSRAFLAAGASSVVVSLWDVPTTARR